MNFLNKFNNLSVAISIDNSIVTMSVTDESKNTSVVCANATSRDFLYLITKFNINTKEFIDWLKNNNIDILKLLPE